MKILKILGAITGSLLVLILAVFFIGVAYPLSTPTPAPVTAQLLIRNVTLVDVEAGLSVPGMDILVEEGEIVAVGAELPASAAAVIDGNGKFAIPGLFDMHVHSLLMAPQLTHGLFVAAGVTAVRDMGGCLGDTDSWVACAPDKRRWHADVEAGRLVSPRYDQVTGLAINGGREIPSGFDPALGGATPEGARSRVAQDAARGVDFLKPYSMLPREGYFALAEAAQAEGLYLAGHRPVQVSALEAVAAGQRSIEHAVVFIWECFPDAAAIREAADLRGTYTHEMRVRMIAEHDPEICDTIFAAMAEAGTAFVPTHTTRRLDAYAADEDFLGDERLRYVPGPLRTLWLADADSMASRTNAEGLVSYRDFYRFGIEQTGHAHRAGVTVLAGTDSPDSFAFPGFALHDELAHLVQAGLSPADALRAATIEPAAFLGLEGRAGVLSPGARADVVLLEDNPLEDIEAVRTVDTVVLAGNVYDRAALDEMLATIEATANHWSLWPKFVWQALRSPIFLAQAKD